MKKESSSAAKASVGYTVGNYLLKGIGFATVPLFTRILSQEDFGIYNTFLAYEALLYIFIGMALHSSLKNAYARYSSTFDDYVSSISMLPIFNTIVLCPLALLFNNQIAQLIKLDPNCVIWLVLHSYCSGVIIFYSVKVSLTYNYKDYIKISLINAVSNIFVSVLLICTIFRNERYMGRIVGSTLVYIVVALYIVTSFFFVKKPKINLAYYKYALRISIPIIPHGLAQILLLQFDRIMINSYIGSKEAAVYSFSYTIYSIVQITTNSLCTVYEPWFFKEMNKAQNNILRIKRVGTGIMAIIAFLITMIIEFSPEAILILGSEKYEASFSCLLPVLMAGFFAMAYSVPAVVEYYYEKTKYIALGTTFAAIINAVLNIFFIPRYGYVAAAYTTLFSYVLYFVLHLLVSKALIKTYIVGIKYIIFFIITIIISWGSALGFKNVFGARLCFGFFMISMYYIFAMKVIGKTEVNRLINQIVKKGAD